MSHSGDSQGEGSDSFISREVVIPRLSLGHSFQRQGGAAFGMRQKPSSQEEAWGLHLPCRE